MIYTDKTRWNRGFSRCSPTKFVQFCLNGSGVVLVELDVFRRLQLLTGCDAPSEPFNSVNSRRSGRRRLRWCWCGWKFGASVGRSRFSRRSRFRRRGFSRCSRFRRLRCKSILKFCQLGARFLRTMPLVEVVLDVIKNRPICRFLTKQALKDRLTLSNTEIKYILFSQADRRRRGFFHRRCCGRCSCGGFYRRSPASTTDLHQAGVKLVEATTRRALRSGGLALDQQGLTLYPQTLDFFAACLGRVELPPRCHSLCGSLTSREEPLSRLLPCLDTFRVLTLPAPTLSLKLLDRRIALRGGRLLLQFLDGLRELRERLTDRLVQRLINDGLGRRYRRRGRSRSLGGTLCFLLGSFLADNVNRGGALGSSIRTPGATPQGKIHQPLDDCTGSATIRSLLAKALDERLVRLVHSPGDHVLGKTRGCFLRGFFTTSNERTLDPGHGTQHLPFGDAGQDPEWGEDLQGARDGAQSGGRAPLLSGGSLSFGPGSCFTGACSNAQAHGAKTTRPAQGPCQQKGDRGSHGFRDFPRDALFIPRSRGKGRLGSTSYPGNRFTSGTLLLLRKEG